MKLIHWRSVSVTCLIRPPGRYFLRYTVRDLTDVQAAQATTASELCLRADLAPGNGGLRVSALIRPGTA
jgi:hypothetical protein